MHSRGFVEVLGQRLEYELLGPEPSRGPCLVLLHEGLGCVELWRDFPAALQAATGASVFSYSRAGYGRSSACDLPRPLDYLRQEAVQVLPALLERIGLVQGALLGHSDGASIAAIHAGLVGASALRGLVLMAPHFFTEDAGIAAIRDAREAFESGCLRQRLARYHGDNVEQAFRGWNDAWLDPRFRGFDIRDLLGAIRVPVCVVQGRDDAYGSDAQLREAEARVRSPLRVARLEHCGHRLHRDRGESVVSLVGEFFAGLAWDDGSGPVSPTDRPWHYPADLSQRSEI